MDFKDLWSELFTLLRPFRPQSTFTESGIYSVPQNKVPLIIILKYEKFCLLLP